MLRQSNHTNSPSPSTNKTKIIAVVVLGFVFVAVIGMQVGGASANSLTEITASTANSYTPPTNSGQALQGNQPADEPPLPLPPVDIQQILAQDPFRCQLERLAVTKDSEDLDSHRATEELLVTRESQQLEIPVTAIVTGGKRAAALIGDAFYHEQDVLENGWQIVAIKANSILVEAK
ncbi:MAG: hypothetical protein R3C53_08755 [Pirellulaceae bacterium]